jgi:hypothetical protein
VNALFKQGNIYQFKCGLKLLLPPYYTVGAAAIFINSSVALKLLLPLCWRGGHIYQFKCGLKIIITTVLARRAAAPFHASVIN